MFISDTFPGVALVSLASLASLAVTSAPEVVAPAEGVVETVVVSCPPKTPHHICEVLHNAGA